MRFIIGLAFTTALLAQNFEQRGFFETRGTFYPQDALNDSGNAIGEALFRYEASRTLFPGLKLHGSFDARTDTHWMTERGLHLDWQDRHLRRPAFSVRRLSLVYSRGKFTAEVGRQFIRWGKTDILVPTDRFAPRDYMEVVDNDFLGVPAVRLTYESGSTTVDAVWQVRFVPSRTPLINQRWTVLPEVARQMNVDDMGSRFPGGSAFGARVNHVGRGYDASVSFYDGWNHLPLLDGTYVPSVNTLLLQRYFPQMRMYGGDFAVPLRWLTVKGEAGYFTSSTKTSDEYVLYVLQLERQTGEWLFVGGYAGEAVTERRGTLDFSPERGLTRAFVGRASYTIDPNRSVLFEAAIRQNGDGIWLRTEYTQAFGQHWRVTGGLVMVGGKETDFLGQYHRNSHGILSLRYSF